MARKSSRSGSRRKKESSGKKDDGRRILASNRRARRNYEILAKLEMFNPYSLKDRPARYLIEDAEQDVHVRRGVGARTEQAGESREAVVHIDEDDLDLFHFFEDVDEAFDFLKTELSKQLTCDLGETP